jgi:hypothetical protein
MPHWQPLQEHCFRAQFPPSADGGGTAITLPFVFLSVAEHAVAAAAALVTIAATAAGLFVILGKRVFEAILATGVTCQHGPTICCMQWGARAWLKTRGVGGGFPKREMVLARAEGQRRCDAEGCV